MADNISFCSRRSTVFATGGMVASSQPLATQAGLSMLQQGGNAADAAVATAAALAVTEPCSTGLGGDFFALYYDADRSEVTALNGSGRAPGRLSLELLHEQGITNRLPERHAHTVTVPGACAGWCDLLARYGTLEPALVLEPAIRFADQGFPVAPLTSFHWRRSAALLRETGPELLINGEGPQAGQVFQNPGMARTLNSIAEEGKEAFYHGPIAEEVVRTIEHHGGVMSKADLAAHKSTWEEPISTAFGGVRLYECPPNGQGLTALLALNILSQFDLCALGETLSPTRLHHMIEAFRLAFADARWYVADPQFGEIPISELLSGEYSARRAALINPSQATLTAAHGQPRAGSDTVYFSVVDGRGNACSVVNSNYQGFGSHIVPPGLGFSLQNRGLGFSLDPEHSCALAPGKRPYHTIIPAMATREADQSLYASFGVMGGYMQPQGHIQVLLSLVLDQLDPQSALDRPRFQLLGGDPAGAVALEEGIPEASVRALGNMGHTVEVIRGHNRSMFGRGQIILRDPKTGLLSAGSDPRADGCALGF